MKRLTYIFWGIFLFIGQGVLLQAQNNFPAFQFADLEGKAFSNAQLSQDMATIAFFFDPYCDHCAQQAAWISEAPEKFKDIQMIWVSTESPESIKEFATKYFDLEAWKHVHFLVDTNFAFDAYFGYSEVPSIYLFNKKGQRVKAFNRETPADILLRFL